MKKICLLVGLSFVLVFGSLVVLNEKEGPYRIVIPDEKRMARWVRQVTTLKIVNVQ